MIKSQCVWVLIGMLVLAACGPAATATPAATPTRAAATPGTTVAPTATAVPGATVPPTPRPTPAPTAARSGPKAGGTIRFPQRAETPSWDPSKTHVEPMTLTRTIVFTKLFTMWSQRVCGSEVYPWGVQSWRWVDDTTAEFTLKPGMTYQNKPPVNGREVVAQDFKPSFARYQKNLAVMQGKSAIVESLTVKDKYTFQMKLSTPWGGLIEEMMAHHWGPWLEPPEAGGPEGTLWEQPEKSWIGSGAFVFDTWTPGVKWRLVRNQSYWTKGKPYVEEVEYLVVPESSTQFAALRSGKLNLIRDLPEQLLGQAKRTVPGLESARCPGTGLSGAGILWMNNTGPPFNDIRVRRAVALAIDHQSIINTLYEGKAGLSPVLPPATQYALALQDFPPDARQFLQYNPAQARQLLSEAGYPNGFDTVISFTPVFPAPAMMVTEAIVNMLREVGVRAKLNIMEQSRYTSTVYTARYPVGEMAMAPRSATTPEDIGALIAHWSKSGTANRSLVKDPDYDQLFEQFQAAQDEGKRKDLAQQLQVMTARKAYAVPLPMPDVVMVALPGIHFHWAGNFRDFTLLLETMWMESA